MSADEPWLTTPRVMEIFDVSRVTIWKWRTYESLPFYKIKDHVYFKESEIRGWIQAHRVENPRSPKP